MGMLAAALLLAETGVAATTAVPAMAATETISGTITCFYGNDQNVGVWVETSSGTSGWAALGTNADGQSTYSYNKVNVGASYRLHVGCSGTPSNWGTTFYTPYVTGTYYDWICTTGYGCYQS